MNKIEQPYSKEASEIIAALQSNSEFGLSDSDADDRIRKYGKNVIKEKEKDSLLKIVIKQFTSPLVYLLLFAAALSFFFKEWLDGTAIIIVIIINAIIGFLMEFQAERSMDALKKLVTIPAKVIRNGKLKEVDSDLLVPGDLLFLEAGDVVLADARVIRASQLQVEESSLTGESVPVEKVVDKIGSSAPLAERNNMVFKGTFVSRGNAKAIVVSTGMETELGRIAEMIQNADQAATPLEKKLEQFSKKLIAITAALVIIIFFAGLLNGQHLLEMLETSIALAVAAIPEGLPIVATLALAQGMLKMASRNVIVKKLSAVETLGGVTVICTDKTGTLTENKIEVGTLAFAGKNIDVEKSENIYRLSADTIRNTPEFKLLSSVAVLCNTAEINTESNRINEVGDPLETSLLKFVHFTGTDITDIRGKFTKIDELPFSSETKIMITLHQNGNHLLASAKGAVEEILVRCSHVQQGDEIIPLTTSLKANWMLNAEQLSAQGQRTIALAYKLPDNPNDFQSQLILLATVGLFDPPRQEVSLAIEECKSAGIKVVMITGDHPSTARNIAWKLGMIENVNETVVMGREMPDASQLSQQARQHWLSSTIFARVTPKQKLDLVTIFQDDKQIVAMTGDGVNDAPALKKADIGIAMGLRGTQVAQQVADIVLKDDSFSSIVTAIRQGRVIFENIRRFIVYLLSCNLSELFVISVASILNLHFQLFPLQILFINLVTDVLPALALGVTEPNENVMKQSPRKTDEPIIGKIQWRSIFMYSSILGGFSLGAVLFSHFSVHKMETWDSELCNNILFYTLIMSQLLHVFNMAEREMKKIFANAITRNKYAWYAIAICTVVMIAAYLISPVRQALSVEPMSAADWLIVGAFSVASLIVIQTLKRFNLIK